MKILPTILAALFIGFSVNAQIIETNFCLRQPKRIFGSASVDLTPIFKSWVKQVQDNSDPKKKYSHTWPPPTNGAPKVIINWVRITGQMEKEVTWGWVVNATIEETPGTKVKERIILRRPPASEKNEFDAMTQERAQLLALKERATSAADDNTDAGHEAFAKGDLLRTVGSATGGPGDDNPYNRAANNAETRGMQYHSQAAAQYRTAADAAQRLADIGLVLQKYPPGEVYQIDFIGLRTTEVEQGLRVYNLGLMYP